MLRLLSDENFNEDVIRGLLRRLRCLDLVRVQDVGLSNTDDPLILAWAATESRILLTHDRRTMPDFAYERVEAGQPMPGVFVVPDRMPVGKAIDAILLLAGASEQEEHRDQVKYLSSR